MPSAYGEFGDDVGPRECSYDDVGACEESYTSHSEPRFDVRYNPFIHKSYESYDESTNEEFEDSYSLPCSTSYQSLYIVNGYTSYSGGVQLEEKGMYLQNQEVLVFLTMLIREGVYTPKR